VQVTAFRGQKIFLKLETLLVMFVYPARGWKAGRAPEEKPTEIWYKRKSEERKRKQ
jgi:hypothetical protein